jgi:hypothetical protein
MTNTQRIAKLEKQIVSLIYARAHSDLGIVVHGDDPDTPRPAADYKALAWIGKDEPTAARDFDLWYQLK